MWPAVSLLLAGLVLTALSWGGARRLEETNAGLDKALSGVVGEVEVSRIQSWLTLVAGLVIVGIGGLVYRLSLDRARLAGQQERSEFDAHHDSLTGLLNRRGLTELLTGMLDSSGSTAHGDSTVQTAASGQVAGNSVGIIFVDMDRLNVINDSIGHSAGDEVLEIVARRLAETIRDTDYVARFGGDEFVVVTTEASDVDDLETVANRILGLFKAPVTFSDGSSQMVSASLGLAYSGGGEALAGDLLRDADLAMFRAKGAGGNRYASFDAELRLEALARLEIEQDLRRAIRMGELVVHYQPIVELQTGSVDRLEALVRWQHPERGMIPPGAFLSVAAESGLIVDIGEHVLRESCRQVALWTRATGRKIKVSVNLSERQLLEATLVDTVSRALLESGIDAAQLELELTEELLVEQLGHRMDALYELADMGVKLAIDDFGTARASLGQLKSLDMVSTLKIDRAFVIDVATDSVDRKIVTAIVALAESVGMEVVAEGVEDRDQVQVLREIGVNLIQGFYFQRPLPSDQAASIITKTFEVPASDKRVKI